MAANAYAFCMYAMPNSDRNTLRLMSYLVIAAFPFTVTLPDAQSWIGQSEKAIPDHEQSTWVSSGAGALVDCSHIKSQEQLMIHFFRRPGL